MITGPDPFLPFSCNPPHAIFSLAFSSSPSSSSCLISLLISVLRFFILFFSTPVMEAEGKYQEAAVELGKEIGVEPLSAQDVASASNHLDIAAQHYDLDLDVDFEKQRISGVSNIKMNRLNSEAKEVLLDVHKLEIHSVKVNDTDAGFKVEEFAEFGSRLRITLPDVKGTDLRVSVNYHTLATALGACFLRPEQTAGKKHPYLYTQGQACLNRSLFPCQDTPALRITYSANVTVPSGLVAVMSAEPKHEVTDSGVVGEEVKQDDGVTKSRFRFEMPCSIPVGFAGSFIHACLRRFLTGLSCRYGCR